MDYSTLKKWLESPHQLSEQDFIELSDAIVDYPYSQPLRLFFLVQLKKRESEQFSEELKKAALYIADRKLLYFILEDNSEKEVLPTKNGVIGEEQRTVIKPAIIKETVKKATNSSSILSDEMAPDDHTDQTLDLIDSFLSTLPQGELESDGLELASDYTSYLLDEEEINSAPPLDGQDLIDEFICIHKSGNQKSGNVPDFKKISMDTPQEGDVEISEPESEDEGFFTETLAKIYVKQQRYDKALEILKKLSLKYPNKNAYFADQIRFLEKLIINDKSK